MKKNLTPTEYCTNIGLDATKRKVTGDGRLAAIYDRGIKKVAAAYPGTYKQIEKSKTMKAEFDKLLKAEIEHRVERFLKANP